MQTHFVVGWPVSSLWTECSDWSIPYHVTLSCPLIGWPWPAWSQDRMLVVWLMLSNQLNGEEISKTIQWSYPMTRLRSARGQLLVSAVSAKNLVKTEHNPDTNSLIFQSWEILFCSPSLWSLVSIINGLSCYCLRGKPSKLNISKFFDQSGSSKSIRF